MDASRSHRLSGPTKGETVRGPSHQRDARAVDQGVAARRRQLRIERQIGGSRLEDGEQRDDHLHRALQADADHHLRPGAATAEIDRQPVGAPRPARR